MKQFTLITADRKGLAAEIADVLGKAGINILELNAQSVSGSALVEICVDKADDAMHILSAYGFQIVTDDVITLKLQDQPGALAQVTRQLSDAGLSIRGISTLQRHGGVCYVALSTDDDVKARQLMKPLVVG
ncbi:ACT domain-containing protein [Leeia oryzae]|uniref:ACT domain-containing protein n=1 Tax=Leeia oryzae TaxID=356662 RepID=UPI000371AF9D|nr:ACT domain-containing protein [Leeia oryzae]